MRRGKKANLAYIVGIALGDGNLSNPNGRATRLRITCDTKYPLLIEEIVSALKALFPNNSVSIVPSSKQTYLNISVYSNGLNQLLPWKVGEGSKIDQQAHVPDWILQSKTYSMHCLRGLLQTDGSIYHDRGYRMINFTNNIKPLAQDVFLMFGMLGYHPTMSHTLQKSGNNKYCVRLAKKSRGVYQKKLSSQIIENQDIIDWSVLRTNNSFAV